MDVFTLHKYLCYSWHMHTYLNGQNTNASNCSYRQIVMSCNDITCTCSITYGWPCPLFYPSILQEIISMVNGHDRFDVAHDFTSRVSSGFSCFLPPLIPQNRLLFHRNAAQDKADLNSYVYVKSCCSVWHFISSYREDCIGPVNKNKQNLWHQNTIIWVCSQYLKDKHANSCENMSECFSLGNIFVLYSWTEVTFKFWHVWVSNQSSHYFGPWPSMISIVWKQPLVFAQMLQCELCLQGQGWVPLCSPLHSNTGNALPEPGRTRRLSRFTYHERRLMS